MRCPKCGSERSSVVDSRGEESTIRRRRECQTCKFRFTTFERIELSLPVVIKKDGRREQFNREKVHAGIVRACEKRPVSAEQIDATVDAIERKLYERGVREVPSREIGEVVMDALRNLDQIAYVRFASVYREFSDVSQFVATLESLDAQRERALAEQQGRTRGPEVEG